MSHLVYGLDFGTTNSAIALYRNGKVISVPVGVHGEFTMQSVLFFSDKSTIPYIGDVAVERYISSDMNGRLIQSPKSILPDEMFSGVVIGYEHYEIEDFVALIIRGLKQRADQLFGIEVDSVVLGMPAQFSTDPKEQSTAETRLVDAARRAGFREVSLQYEPIAAALTYEQSIKSPELVMVADLGGGTSDFTIMRLSPDHATKRSRNSDILATHGVEVGGDRLDSQIMLHKLVKYFGSQLRWKSWDRWFDMPAHFIHTICEWRRIPFLKNKHDRDFVQKLIAFSDDRESSLRLQALIEENLGYSLFQAIDRAKCELSDSELVEIEYNRLPISIHEPIHRDEFNSAIHPQYEQIRECVISVLNDAGVEMSQIDSVFMTGGTSYVPIFRQMMGELFEPHKVKSGEMYTSVVTGLALSAPLFFHDA